MALAALAAAWVGAKLLGQVARTLKQPAVLGELIAGVVLGGSAFGLLDPTVPLVHVVSEIGVVVLLFMIGLETDVSKLLKVGGAATAVAVIGVIVPSVSGYFVVRALGAGANAALVCGAALCATSVGITARVLEDLRRLDTSEGRVILGAAVIDDVIGLGILAVVAAMVAKGTSLMDTLSSLKIVAAFGVGLLVHKTHARHAVQRVTKRAASVVVPLFFASVGAAVSLRALSDPSALWLGTLLITCGVVGKLVAGWGAGRLEADKLLIGLGMIPRGEVGLVFAQMGLASGAIDVGQYGALTLMVLVTTFVTPPALAWRAGKLGTTVYARGADGRMHY
jgi:Kef-type K+ transport system membrane component KefB